MSAVQNRGTAKLNNLHRVTQVAAEDLGLMDVTAPSLTVLCYWTIENQTSNSVPSQTEHLLGMSQNPVVHRNACQWAEVVRPDVLQAVATLNSVSIFHTTQKESKRLGGVK